LDRDNRWIPNSRKIMTVRQMIKQVMMFRKERMKWDEYDEENHRERMTRVA
jgi:hypothetical protein